MPARTGELRKPLVSSRHSSLSGLRCAGAALYKTRKGSIKQAAIK
ncbi:Unknown protein sequence [Pseudomonas savastanoi pv. phaseolicola]|nr:Unknown protein sequence [Pseudomonas savastanoi pv. phaseolicola]